MDNGQWTINNGLRKMDDGQWGLAWRNPSSLPLTPSGGGKYESTWNSISPFGGGRMYHVKWRTYGTLVFLWFGALLQSFCHHVAILANRLSDWNTESLTDDTFKVKVQSPDQVQSMPHRGKSFVALVKPTFLFLLPNVNPLSGQSRSRTYGTLVFFWFDALLQSFCHHVAILANRLGDWNTESLTDDTFKITVQSPGQLQPMPHRGKSFVALVQPTFLYLPLRGKTPPKF
jgi:hypothetical protein